MIHDTVQNTIPIFISVCATEILTATRIDTTTDATIESSIDSNIDTSAIVDVDSDHVIESMIKPVTNNDSTNKSTNLNSTTKKQKAATIKHKRRFRLPFPTPKLMALTDSDDAGDVDDVDVNVSGV